jgi:hypothetical protein
MLALPTDFLFQFLHICTRLHVDSTADHSLTLQNTLTTMAGMTEIAPNDTIPPLPPLPGAAPLVHIPGMGDGKNWPLASAGIAVAGVATPQPWQHWMRISLLNRRGN